MSYIPETYIKDVAIEISKNYEFDNLPHSSEPNNKTFIGRREEIEKFKQLLEKRRGVFLVTGYRGVGKTSFVNKVWGEVKEGLLSELEQAKIPFRTRKRKAKSEAKRYLRVAITIAQRQPSETDTLRIMVSSMLSACKEKFNVNTWKFINTFFTTFSKITGAISIALLLGLIYKSKKLRDVFLLNNTFKLSMPVYSPEIIEDTLKLALVWVTMICLVTWLISVLVSYLAIPRIITELDELFKRCYSSLTLETGSASELMIESWNTKLSNAKPRRAESYPVASSKEIEFELTNIIKKASLRKHNRHRLHFYFVFDELDKIEEMYSGPFNVTENKALTVESNPERIYLEQLRIRKQAVLNIIAGLKNFLTTAEAAFIFIAGREMFDASLADIADRQSSVSSVFTYVFYVESFLKERHLSSSSLSASIEKYLYKIIYGKDLQEGESLYDYNKNYKDLRDPAKLKVELKNIEDKISEIDKTLKPRNWINSTLYHKQYQQKKRLLDNTKTLKEVLHYSENYLKVNLLVQSFVVYLTYRSNGSPKKLIRLIHEFTKYISENDLNSEEKIVWRNENEKSNQYLYFNYKNQQRIGFINYIYRPFLVKYGNSFRNYSDSLIVSTSYLFDHFLKFHPFAFSLSHLEVLPEVLSANRTPALRDHIKKIIDYLSGNFINETEIGLFDYKFYNRTMNEIFYLSKIFEEESAAFNFTLDESYIIKLHIRAKLQELRLVYEKFPDTTENVSHVIYSIAYLNGLLGDLHYFDQEYDDAIIAYSDVLKPIKSLDAAHLDARDFIILLRYKLKLGLTFEKIKAYEESLSFYIDASQDANRFIVNHLSSTFIEEDLGKTSHSLEGSPAFRLYYVSSFLSDLLQVINQPFIATMVIQEKMGVEGITAKKSAITMGNFLHLSNFIEQRCGKNNIIVANFYLEIGKLLYFKNSAKAFEWDKKDQVDNPMPKTYRDDIIGLIKIHEELANSFEIRIPIMAMNMYLLGIKYLLEGRILTPDPFKLKFTQGNTIWKVINELNPITIRNYTTSLSKNQYKYIAIFLSNIGDCMLGMLKPPNKVNNAKNFQVTDIVDVEYLDEISRHLQKKHQPNNQSNIQNVDQSKENVEKKENDKFKTSDRYKSQKTSDHEYTILTKIFPSKNNDPCFANVFIYYYMSAYYYRLAGKIRSYSFQLRKILYFIRLVISDEQNDTQNSKNLITVIEQFIVQKILIAISENGEFTNVHDYEKFTHFLAEFSGVGKQNFILNNIANFPDAREVVILFAHIKLRLQSSEDRQAQKSELIKSNYSISTQYLRLLELTYAAKYYELKIKDYNNQEKQVVESETKKASVHRETSKEIKEYILSYLHSLLSVINIMEIYDNDYLVGNSFTAYHHLRLADFLYCPNNVERNGCFNKFYLSADEIKKILESAEFRKLQSDKSSFEILTAEYNYSMAAMYYNRAIKVHTAGNEYKKAMSDVLYLEDDLNDASYHFGAAMDRYLLVNNRLHSHFSECKNKMKPDWNNVENYLA